MKRLFLFPFFIGVCVSMSANGSVKVASPFAASLELSTKYGSGAEVRG